MRGSAVGTIVELPDGRRGTTVYNGLDGVGIKWGKHILPPGAMDGTSGGVIDDRKCPDDWEWFPEAMLRESYPSADLECVGEIFEIISVPEKEQDR